MSHFIEKQNTSVMTSLNSRFRQRAGDTQLNDLSFMDIDCVANGDLARSLTTASQGSC
jgi:hypothetical protein